MACASLPVQAAPPPQLKAISPSAPVTSPTPQVLTLTGDRFVLPKDKQTFYILKDGQPVGTVGMLKDTSVQWAVVLSAAGTFKLSVKNPDGKTSNVLTVTVVTPPPPPPPNPPPPPPPPPPVLCTDPAATNVGEVLPCVYPPPDPPDPPSSNLAPHGVRLGLTPAIRDRIAAKRAANDPDWLQLQTRANDLLTKAIPAAGTWPDTGCGICWGQSGDGWLEAAEDFTVLDAVTGDPKYGTKAIQLLTYIVSIGGVEPVRLDSGRGSFGSTPALAKITDYFHDRLTPQQLTAAIDTLNRWSDWTTVNGYAVQDPTSNYWMGHLTATAMVGYATYEDNPKAQQWLDWVQTRWSTDFAKFFFPPSLTAGGAQTAQGFYYGGLAVSGFNYGANDIARHVKYLLLVRAATGVDLPEGTDHALRWARNLVHNLKPDLWGAPTFGQWTADYYGVMKLQEWLLLADFLDGTPEGAWMQWGYTHAADKAPGFPVGATDFAHSESQVDRLFYADASRAASDYRLTQTPFFFSDGGEGNVYWRSSWDANADYLWTRVTPSGYSGSLPKIAGHLDLSRGSDNLLLLSNYFKGTTTGIAGQNVVGGESSAYANTLYVVGADGKLQDGFDNAQPYEGGQLLLWQPYVPPFVELAPDHALIENDYANAYDYSGNKATRKVQYFYRTLAALGDGLYLVWDRVKTSSATDIKQIRFHLPNEVKPTVQGAIVKTTVGQSSIALQFLPQATFSVVQAQVGAGPWQIQVSPSTPSQAFNLLTLIRVAAKDDAGVPPLTANFGPDVLTVNVAGRIVTFQSAVTDKGNGIYQSPTTALKISKDPNVTTLVNDVLLSGSQNYILEGTATSKKVLDANKHRFIIDGGGSWTGTLKLTNVIIKGLGDSSHFAVGDQTGQSYAYLNGAQIDIENCTISNSGAFNFYSANNASIVFKNCTYDETNVVPASGPADQAGSWFTEQGPSGAPKVFQGNTVRRGFASFGSPNWTIGAPKNATDPDTYTNFFVGPRVGFSLADGYASYNYSHVDLNVTPQNPFWSQVGNVGPVGAKAVVEHNIIRSAHWTVAGVDGKVSNNVLLESHGHDMVRIGNGGTVDHNIILAKYPGFDVYGGTHFASTPSVFGLYQTGNHLSIVNNTIDGRHLSTRLVAAIDGTLIDSYRNNVAYMTNLSANGCPASTECSSAIGASTDEGYVTPLPNRAGYLDYNLTHFDPLSPRTVVYDLGVAGKTLGAAGFAKNDLGTLNAGGPDPLFRGPLPIGTGTNGVVSVSESGFPFNDADILNRTFSVSQVLSYFRYVYAPKPTSPVIGKQDPQDGAGDLGAVSIDVVPPTAPAIVTTNKRPMVSCGPSGFFAKLAGFTLSGYAADDGLPSNKVTLAWTMVSGPGTIGFDNADHAWTNAYPSATGNYTLRLTASDGALTSSSDCLITVAP